MIQTVGRTPLDDWSARRTDLYLTTLTTDIHPPAGFEPAIPANEGPQTHVSDRGAAGIGSLQWDKILVFYVATEEISELPITVPEFKPWTSRHEAEMLPVCLRPHNNRQNPRRYCIFSVTVLQSEYPCDILHRSGRNVSLLIGFRMGEKVKSSLFTPWKHTVEWRYSSLIPTIGSRWRGVLSFTPRLL